MMRIPNRRVSLAKTMHGGRSPFLVAIGVISLFLMPPGISPGMAQVMPQGSLSSFAGNSAAMGIGIRAEHNKSSHQPSHSEKGETSEAEQEQTLIEQNLVTLHNTNACPRCNLSGQHLDGLDLISTTLRWSDLSYASLRHTDLVMANLMYTNLQNANFEQADLASAVLEGATLTHARFIGANLEGANLNEATFEQTNFMNANLRHAEIDLAEAMRHGAFFCGATLPDGRLGKC